MTGPVRITSVKKSSGKGKSGQKSHRGDLMIALSGFIPEDSRGRWIHLPSLTSFRLGRPYFEKGSPLYPVRGLSRRSLKAGDAIIPADCLEICSRVFFGTADNLKLPFSGELTFHKQKIPCRLLPSEISDLSAIKTALPVRLELLQPVALLPGASQRIGTGTFTPLTVFPWNPEAVAGAEEEKEEALMLLQGWIPAKSAAPARLKRVTREGNVIFLDDWLEWAQTQLQPGARKEGGLERRKVHSLLSIPPYVADDAVNALQTRGWFTLQEGVLLDSSWDYSASLSPMNRGLLKQMHDEVYLIEKIADSPRGKGLSLLCSTGLALEIEPGVFMPVDLLEDIAARVDDIRTENPEVTLGELARDTGIKKRYLISLLQYRDTFQ